MVLQPCALNDGTVAISKQGFEDQFMLPLYAHSVCQLYSGMKQMTECTRKRVCA